MPLAAHLKISRHGIYYFRVVVPISLRSKFGGRSEIKKSLGTRDPRTAKRFAYNLSSYVLALFDEVRPMAGYNPNRFNPNDPSTWPTETKGKYEIDIQRGIFKADPKIKGDHENMMEAIEKIGMVSFNRPEAVSQTTVAAVQSAVASAIKTLPIATARVVGKPEKLSVVIASYIASLRKRNLAAKTPDTYESNCRKFLKVVGDKFIHEVDEDDIAKFKDWCLVDEPTLKLQSLDGRLGPISTLLKFAQKQRHFPKGSVPTEGMFELTKSEREDMAIGAEPFTIEELQRIFEPASYLKYVSGQPARFWLPILALYSGARIEELAQLHRSDICEPQGVPILDINDLDNKAVKSAAGKRRVPIHPMLLNLGFDAYIKDINRLYPDEKMLFPHLIKTKNGFSAAVGKAFNKYLVKLGIKPIGEQQRTKVFHSYRDTMNNEMGARGVTLEMRCLLVGHELNNVNVLRYTSDTPHQTLLDQAILTLSYERADGAGNVIKLNLLPLKYKAKQFDKTFPKLMEDKTSGASFQKSKFRDATLAKKSVKRAPSKQI